MRIEISEAQTYIESLQTPETTGKLLSRQFAEELGLARICLSPSEGKLLSLLVRMHQCQRFVEIGTLTGLSAQYILDGLDIEGRLWTLEKSPVHAKKAREALDTHEGGPKTTILVGDARETLSQLEHEAPYDAIFIDGNKAAYGDYLTWAEANIRKGGLIIADNVFLSGAVWGASTTQNFSEKQVRVLQDFNRRLADPTKYEGSILPTQEGLLFAIKKF